MKWNTTGLFGENSAVPHELVMMILLNWKTKVVAVKTGQFHALERKAQNWRFWILGYRLIYCLKSKTSFLLETTWKKKC